MHTPMHANKAKSRVASFAQGHLCVLAIWALSEIFGVSWSAKGHRQIASKTSKFCQTNDGNGGAAKKLGELMEADAFTHLSHKVGTKHDQTTSNLQCGSYLAVFAFLIEPHCWLWGWTPMRDHQFGKPKSSLGSVVSVKSWSAQPVAQPGVLICFDSKLTGCLRCPARLPFPLCPQGPSKWKHEERVRCWFDTLIRWWRVALCIAGLGRCDD